MDWYDLLRNISIVGLVCSIIITGVSFILLWLNLKSDKYLNKLVVETPILKYLRNILIGFILISIFEVTIQLLIILKHYLT